MKKNIFLPILILGLWHTGMQAQTREEFNGPFPSWANIKQRFGAKGNGRDDDTKAFQNALDSLSNPVVGFNTGPSAYMVVYLPAGTYCLSSTLQLKGKIGVSIIGEDPVHTIIKWIGGDKDTMLWTNASAYFKISRISWDAGGRNDMEAIGIHWKDRWRDAHSMSFAPLNIEVSDCYFTGGFKFGISGGTTGAGGTTNNNDSEVTIRRCVFSGCTQSAIEIEGYNALDYWIWDCKFLECNFGVSCTFGNFHVFRSYFRASITCDVHHSNGYYTSVRGCYSDHSFRFSEDVGMSTNPFKRTYQDNMIINPRESPVAYTHTGKMTFLGNTITEIQDIANTTNKSIYYGSWAYSNYEILSLHNSYPRQDHFQIGKAGYTKIYSAGDVIQPDAPKGFTAQTFLKGMDPLPRRVTRKIFDVPSGAGSPAIQAMIDQAAAMKGQRPVIHFGMGTYYIDRPLMIPAGADMQIEGDGLVHASIITTRSGKTTFAGPLFMVKGPSYITIRDLQAGDQSSVKSQYSCIVFENVDQPGAQAHLDQIYSKADTSLYAGGLDYLYIQKDNSFFAAGNYVSGGPKVMSNKGTARVCCYGGQFARLSVQQNGRFLAKDCWWEGSERRPLELSGSGSISLDGAMIAASGADSLPTIAIGGFNGNISIMNMYVWGGLSVQPDNPNLNLMIWNILFYHKMDPLDILKSKVSYKGAFAGLNAQCFRPNDPVCKSFGIIGDQFPNVTDPNAFMDAQTTQDRQSAPVLYTNLSAGQSNISISRVSLGNTNRGVEFGL